MEAKVQKTPVQEKRDYLKKLSDKVFELVQDGEFVTINEAVIAKFYQSDLHREFDTFKGWLKKGRVVNKGETAFVIWGSPLKSQKDKKEGEETNEPESKDLPPEERPYNFFPICHIFSNAQTKQLEK